MRRSRRITTRAGKVFGGDIIDFIVFYLFIFLSGYTRPGEAERKMVGWEHSVSELLNISQLLHALCFSVVAFGVRK